MDVAFVLNMTQTEDYKDGIFLLSHWKLQNIIYEQPIIQRKVRVVFNSKGRVSYKIFAGNEDLHLFLKKNKDKKCKQMTPVFNVGEYKEYPHAEIRKLTSDEIKQYMSER